MNKPSRNPNAYDELLTMMGAETPPNGQWTKEWEAHRKMVRRLAHNLLKQAADRAVFSMELGGIKENILKGGVRHAILRPVTRRLMGRAKARCGLKRTVAAGPK